MISEIQGSMVKQMILYADKTHRQQDWIGCASGNRQ